MKTGENFQVFYKKIDMWFMSTMILKILDLDSDRDYKPKFSHVFLVPLWTFPENFIKICL